MNSSNCRHVIRIDGPLATIGKSIGYVDPKTTARYAHMADSSALNAQDMFSKVVAQQVQ